MSVPAVAEQAGWQSRRISRLPTRASVYAAAVCTAAAAAVVWSGLASDVERDDWTTFALLLPLAVASPLFRVSVGRNHGFHIAPVFMVAGALVLPPVLVVALVASLVPTQLLKDRTPWYIQLFNTANYVLSALSAWAATNVVGERAADPGFALMSVGAAAAFVGVNHGLLAVMLRLGRGHSIRETGLFSPTGLAGELALAGLGIAVGAFALLNPWLLPALVAPILLAHRSFSTVALLRESEERFRTMFQSAPTAILMLGLDGRITAVNSSCERMLGYSEPELVGGTTPQLGHPDDAAELAGDLAELVSGERDEFRREARYVRKDGAVVVTQLAAALVRDADGKPDYVIAMAEDVTEQRQLEEQLRQSQKLEAIGRLAGGVAHDFNNMLTAIGGYTALALEHATAGSELQGDLDEIRKATDRAALLTRQLLAFSRKQMLVPELLNLNGVVLELESMLRPLIGEDVELTTTLDPALGPIEADPGQLQQVLMNLVVNARDAMPQGGRIWIETGNAQIGANDEGIESGRYVTLAVRDSGEGIDEATLGQIFEPFFTTKESGKGTGLGLATVYGIVKQSGGYVAVDSEVGRGSAFTIYLPRADGPTHAPPLPAAEPARAEEPAQPEPVAPLAPVAAATVLVVEDEEVIRGLVDQALRGEGYRVILAADGDEALERARGTSVDVLLTDLTMPGIGGRELAERLRAERPELKVMFMSGFADSDALAGGHMSAWTTFLEKPFTFAHLTERIRSLVQAG